MGAKRYVIIATIVVIHLLLSAPIATAMDQDKGDGMPAAAAIEKAKAIGFKQPKVEPLTLQAGAKITIDGVNRAGRPYWIRLTIIEASAQNIKFRLDARADSINFEDNLIDSGALQPNEPLALTSLIGHPLLSGIYLSLIVPGQDLQLTPGRQISVAMGEVRDDDPPPKPHKKK